MKIEMLYAFIAMLGGTIIFAYFMCNMTVDPGLQCRRACEPDVIVRCESSKEGIINIQCARPAK